MLRGFRVLDLTDQTGQLCARMLGDLGADVIKVEPPGGDPSRRLGPFYHDVPHSEKSLYWFAYNTNKRSITLNLETADGRNLFKRLAATANLIVESFKPGYLAAQGVGYEDLRRANPGLVVTSITPYGQTGPDAMQSSADLLIMAQGGLLLLCGETDGPPGRMRIPQSYCEAGAQSAMVSASALFHSERTGVGQHIDVSMQEAIADSLITVQQHWDLVQLNEKRGTTVLRGGAVYGNYSWPAKDGHIAWCWWVAPGWGFKMYPLLEWMNDEKMAGDLWENDWDARSTSELSQEEVDHWEGIFTAFFKTHTKKEIFEKALERRIMLYPTYTTADLLEFPQLLDRGYFQDVEHPELGETIRYPGAFVKTSGDEWSLRRRPPLIGEHNREVYCTDLKLSQEDLIILKAAGAI